MTCSSCGQSNRDGARFCDNCGSPLSQSPPAPAYAPPEALAQRIRRGAAALEGERKQVTVLFADVSGSMDLAEQVDAETWRRILDRFFVVLCDGVHRFDGTVAQFTGDGIMALFGAPVAHEDHAVRAAHAALALCRDLTRHAADVRREHGLGFSVRLGLNSGEVVVGALGDDLKVEFTAIGHTVGLAKRMEALAEPGKPYVTAATAGQLEGYFELRDLGAFDVKGVREPVRAYELVGPGPARNRLDRSRRRGFSRFVGREAELGVLEDALERALAGDGQVVGVVGEAGVGKSRLCHEFTERARRRGVPVFRAAGAAHARGVPFHVALEMLRGYFGIDDDTSAQAARERVAGRLLLLDERFGPKLPIVFEFLGIGDPARPTPRMDPDARRGHLLAAARQLVHRHAAREAAVNLIEDLHWIDDGSRAFLDALVEAVPGHRSLVVVNFRPDFRPPWRRIDAYREIALSPLGSGAVGELLDDLLGRDPSLDGLPEEIVRRTDGNPFFVEEVVQALVEEGALVGARGGRRLARSLGAIAVPASVQAVLAARIDRLAPRDKAVLQAASVVGRVFPEAVVARVMGLADDEVQETLAPLAAAGFVVGGEEAGEHAFRHPLTQEVAYGSLLAERRRALHAAVAEATTALDPERLDERAALVAHHWEAAGDALEAARSHAQAAAWAGTQDIGHAAEHWRAVRRLCAALPAGDETTGLAVTACLWMLQLSWRLGMAPEDVDELYADARRLCEPMDDEVTMALLTTTWASVVAISRDMSVALEAVRPAHETVRRAGRSDIEVTVLLPLSYALMVSGHCAEAIAATDRGIELTGRDRSLGAGVAVQDPHAWFHMMRGCAVMTAGRLQDARASLSRSIELAEAGGDLETLGWAHMSYGLVAHFTADADGAAPHVLRSVDLAEEIGSPFSRIWARYNLGVLRTAEERWGDAETELRDALALIDHHGTGRECWPWAMTMLAWTLVALGRPAEAEDAARAAFDDAQARGVLGALPVARSALVRALLARHGAAAADRAQEVLDRALAEIQEMGCYAVEPDLRLSYAEVHALRGDADACEAELARARAAAQRNAAGGRLRHLQQPEPWRFLPSAPAVRAGVSEAGA